MRQAARTAAGLGTLASVPLRAAEAVTNTLPQAVAPSHTDFSARTWLRTEALGVPLWEYLAFLLYIILAFYIAKLVDYIVEVQLRKWAARTAARFDDLVLASLHGPIRVITLIILLAIGVKLFAWSAWTSGFRTTAFISDGLKLLIACSLTYVAIKVVDLLMGLWQQRVQSAEESALDLHLFPLIRNTLKVFVLVVAALVVSQNFGMNVTGLLASLSIGGLALGLAAQETLSNLFRAVAIFADKPFRIGDRIQLDGIEGTVEAIGLRSTRLRNLDGILVTIPNKTIAGASISNVSKRPGIRTVMNICVTWDTPAQKVERAIALINEVYRSHPKTADLLVSFNTFDRSTINIHIIHWWDSTSLTKYLLGFAELNLKMKRRFDAEGLNFGTPSQTVYLRQDPHWRA